MFSHSVTVDEKNCERLKELVLELEKTEFIDRGFGHINSRVYIIYATRNLSEELKKHGFIFTVRQI